MRQQRAEGIGRRRAIVIAAVLIVLVLFAGAALFCARWSQDERQDVSLYTGEVERLDLAMDTLEMNLNTRTALENVGDLIVVPEQPERPPDPEPEPEPEPEPVPVPGVRPLHLRGTVERGGRLLALIDERLVGRGDRVRGHRVLQIWKDRIMLLDPTGGVRRLYLFPNPPVENAGGETRKGSTP